MLNLNELPDRLKQQSLFKECKALGPHSRYKKYLLGEYSPYDHCEANLCYICGLACCNHPDIKEFIKDVDGLDFTTVKAKKIPLSSLPLFIPGIRPGGFKKKVNLPFVVTLVSEISKSRYRKKGGIIAVPDSSIKNNIKKSFNLNPSTKIILLSYGPDKLIEKIWFNDEKEYYPKIKQAKIDMATAFNFSLFWGECRLGQRINLKKSLKTFELYQKYQIPCAPHIYWLNKFDLNEWIKWLSININVKMVALNLQMLGRHDNFVLRGIKYLVENMPRPISLFISGRFDLNFFRELSKITKDVVVSNLRIYIRARCKQELVKKLNGLEFVRNDSLSKVRIFQKGVRLYERELRKIFKK